MLLGIRRRRRDVDGASESRQVARVRRVDPRQRRQRRPRPTSTSDAAALVERLGAEVLHDRAAARARAQHRRADAALDARGPPLQRRRTSRSPRRSPARFALAIDNARLYEAAERSLGLLDTVFATAPVGLAFVDRDLRFVRVNEALAAINGRRSRSTSAGRVARCSAGRARARELHVRRQRRAALDLEAAASAERRRHPPLDRVVHAGARPRGRPARRQRRGHRRHRAPARCWTPSARRARGRTSSPARARCSTRRSTTSGRCARWPSIAVPEIADWCAVSILDERGALQQVAAAHVDPASAGSARSSTAATRRTAARDGGTMRVARSGRDRVRARDHRRDARRRHPRPRAARARAPARACARSSSRRCARAARTFGTLTLANADAGRLFERRRRPARRGARPPRRRSRSTTRGSTPSAPASPTRCRPSCCRRGCPTSPARCSPRATARPASSTRSAATSTTSSRARRRSGRWSSATSRARAPEAAAVTALARYTLRAGALDDDAPGKALRRLNGAMRTHDDTAQFATAALAYVSARRRRPASRVRLALGRPPARDGRPPRRRGRARRHLRRHARRSTPTPRSRRPSSCSTRGDVLLLYTDGVTEAGAARPPVRRGRASPRCSARLAGRAAAGGRRRGRAGRRRRAARASRATTSRCSRSGSRASRAPRAARSTQVSFERTPVMSSTRPTRSPGATNATSVPSSRLRSSTIRRRPEESMNSRSRRSRTSARRPACWSTVSSTVGTDIRSSSPCNRKTTSVPSSSTSS